MIATRTYDDSTCASSDFAPTNSTTTYSIIDSYCKDEYEYEYVEQPDNSIIELQAFHNNKVRISLREVGIKRQRPNNKRLNNNSGLFWHVSDS